MLTPKSPHSMKNVPSGLCLTLPLSLVKERFLSATHQAVAPARQNLIVSSSFLQPICLMHEKDCHPQQPGTQKGPWSSWELHSHLCLLFQLTGHWQQEHLHARNIQVRASSALQPLSSLLAPRGGALDFLPCAACCSLS